MEYKQFETFQNAPLTELQKKHNLNKALLNSSISELKSSKKEHGENLKKYKVENVQFSGKLNTRVNKLINKTNQLVKKKIVEKKITTNNEKPTENKKETKENIVSFKKEIALAEKKTNQEDTSNKTFIVKTDIKTESNHFGKIMPIGFTIIALVCSALLIYTKQVNVYTLLLLSLVVSLTIICHCSIGNFCILDVRKTMWTRTKLGQRCNYTKKLYFTALLCGFFVSYIIFSYDIVIVLIQNIKNYIKNF
jgi:hypothetical protein